MSRSCRRCSLRAPTSAAPGRISGLQNWHDGATFTRFGGTPCLCFGPRDLNAAHTIDEFVPAQDLVQCAQAIAVAAMRFCADGGE